MSDPLRSTCVFFCRSFNYKTKFFEAGKNLLRHPSRLSLNNSATIFILLPCKIPDLYFLKNQLFALKYTLKPSLINLINTSTCFGPISPSSGSCGA